MKQKLSQNKMAANGNDQPDLFKLFDFPSAVADLPNGHAEDGQELSYEKSTDLNSITRRQMQEDISAYRYDIDFCRAMLAGSELSASEIRSLHVRLLDCSHHVRHCQHRIELIDAQIRLGINPMATSNGFSSIRAASQYYHGAPGAVGGVKRKRPKMVAAIAETPAPLTAEEDEEGATPAGGIEGDSIDVATPNSGEGVTSSIQRLGFWMCRLCTAQKYLNAGPSRVPSEPGKWPLKDIAKMFNHFLDLHTEHTPEERLKELGDALAQNQGPFEYWLTRTKCQDIKDMSTIDEYIDMLRSGRLPEALRPLNRAAGVFPNTVSGIKK